jgi:hypothetical protein
VKRASVVSLGILTLALAACGESPIDPYAENSANLAIAADPSGATDESGLQAALAAAAGDPSANVVSLGADITLSSPLTYMSDYPLTLEGRGYAINASNLTDPPSPVPPGGTGGKGAPTGSDALVVMGDGNLTVKDLKVHGAPGHGIYREISADAAGTVEVTLRNVHLLDNGMSALWIEEQTAYPGGAETAIESEASVSLTITKSTIADNGFQSGGVTYSCPSDPTVGDDFENCTHPFADYDGVRVNEGGNGDLIFRLQDSEVTGNAGDGIELDEKGNGSVLSTVQNSTFVGNGEQPQLFITEVGENADPEDGFDIDEEGLGDIRADFVEVEIGGSYDEGIDLDENGGGAIHSAMTQVAVENSVDENIKFSEDEDEQAGGGVYFQFQNVTSIGGDDGIKLEVFGPGNMDGRIVGSRVIGAGGDGIEFPFEKANDSAAAPSGTATVRLQNVHLEDIDDDAVVFEFEDDTVGSGTLLLLNVTFENVGDDEYKTSDNVEVTVKGGRK